MTKKLLLGLITLMLAMTVFAANNHYVAATHHNTNTTPTREDVFYQETFESGMDNWTTLDGTLPSSMWHISDLTHAQGMTPQGTYSWWMGDESIGGYTNHLYVVLDTPQIAIAAGNHLTFSLAYACETPGTSGNYDGWDGCNIRVSTDNGATWTVITGSPAYNCTSMYSFGYEHGEGEGVPGWGGTSNGWVNGDFDLSVYAGQNVKIRFAFASDPSYSTADDPSLFGMIVDNIAVGSFSNNAESGEGDMTYTSMVDVGGDLWHVAEVTGAPSGTHAAVCQNAEGSYDPGMLDYIVSPSIVLPSSGDIRADFQVRGSINDPDEFPDNDYWHFEVSPDDGVTWYAMSNPYGDADGNNYVYSDLPDTWSSMVEAYSTALDGYVSEYAGHTVKFRIGLQSDTDTPDGEGIMIDDFTVYTNVFLPAPTELAATTNEAQTQVSLTWNAPGSGGAEGWIQWDSGENNDSIGTGSAADIFVAARFTAEDLLNYAGGNITSIKFFPNESSCTYALKIWGGTSGTTELYSQDVSNPTIGDWNEITLTTPYAVTSGAQLYIGYEANTTTGYPCGCDAGPHVAERGDYIRTASTDPWDELVDLNSTLDYNWNIEAYVTAGDRKVALDMQRDLTGYNIYRSVTSGTYTDTPIATVPTGTTTYTDNNPTGNTVNYYVVTGVYTDGESSYSNEASAYAMSQTAYEYKHDDGTSEANYAPTANTFMAEHFVPIIVPSVGHADLLKIKVYLTAIGQQNMVVKVWKDDGTDGIPGTAMATFVVTSSTLHTGWNYIDIPASSPIVITSGGYYVGFMGSASASSIGVDNNTTTTTSYVNTGSWAPYTHQFMIRTIMEEGAISNSDNTIPVKSLAARNFPNPFNPVTTIMCSLPQTGHATLKVYNTRGQVVRTLVDGQLNAGNTSVTWNGCDDNGKAVSSGVYFYRLETKGQTITQKMMLMK